MTNDETETFHGFTKNHPLRKTIVDTRNAIKRELKFLKTHHRKKTLLNAKCLQPYDLASDPSPSKPVTTDLETISSVLRSTPLTQVKRRGRPPKIRRNTETEINEVHVPDDDDQGEHGALNFAGFEKDSELMNLCKQSLEMIESELKNEFKGFEPDDPLRADCEQIFTEIKERFKAVTKQDMLY